MKSLDMSSDSEENTDQDQVFEDSDSDSNISCSTVYFSDDYDSNVSWLLVGYQRLFFLLSLLAPHIPRLFCYLFTNLQPTAAVPKEVEIRTSSSQQVHRYIPQPTIHFIECYFVFSPSRTQSSWNAYGTR